MINITSAKHFTEQVLDYDGISVVDFWGVWCAPCKTMREHLTALSSDKGMAGVRFCDINIADIPTLSVEYGIITLPTLIFFNHGRPCGQVTGLVTRQDILKRINAIKERK